MMVRISKADDLKDTFVRHCVISITAGLFFLTPSFVLGRIARFVVQAKETWSI